MSNHSVAHISSYIYWKLNISLIFSVPDIYEGETLLYRVIRKIRNITVYAINDELSMTKKKMNPTAGQRKQRHRETIWLVWACHHPSWLRLRMCYLLYRTQNAQRLSKSHPQEQNRIPGYQDFVVNTRALSWSISKEREELWSAPFMTG